MVGARLPPPTLSIGQVDSGKDILLTAVPAHNGAAVSFQTQAFILAPFGCAEPAHEKM